MARTSTLFGVLLLFQICLLIGMSCEAAKAAKKEPETKPKQEVQPLDESNWTKIMEQGTEWMVAFHAPWCPACKDFVPEFHRFAEWNRSPQLKFGLIDVHAHPGLSGRFLITALPTIYHVKDGVFRYYTGIRDRERMARYMDAEDWFKQEPVSALLYPDSLQMGAVGHFFRLSMNLKNVHSWMVEDKGLPNWLTYVIFAVATVTLGGLIGVLLVVVIEAVTGRGKEQIIWRANDRLESEFKIQSPLEMKPTKDAKPNRSPSTTGTDDSGNDDKETAPPKTTRGKLNNGNASGTQDSGTDEDLSARPEPGGKSVRRRARRED
ncbi:putative Thioredoxin-related transmembrane protein 1 [Hypsibius exemplaris]|uniref:Thioredoxin-related transmembrane protein 1 n=1 Tax=Hypsibius exemplaris TaxID=2072580 RepID=A0A1W0WFZ8_HYPEX|nr:putative Thioredoxin-related transmembrane protein 1 [Hypsibius exemplaris]